RLQRRLPAPRRHLPVGDRAPRGAADPRGEQAEDSVGQRGPGVSPGGVTTSGERSLLAATVGTVVFVAFVPGTVVVVVPRLLSGWRIQPPLFAWAPVRWIGLVLLLLALPVFPDFLAGFVPRCQATPSPIAPPVRPVALPPGAPGPTPPRSAFRAPRPTEHRCEAWARARPSTTPSRPPGPCAGGSMSTRCRPSTCPRTAAPSCSTSTVSRTTRQR